MRKWSSLLLLTALCSLPCSAQYSERYRECRETALTQTAMNACAGEEAKQAETEMQETYRRLVSRAQGQAKAVEKIKAAQDAWIRYRNAYLEAMYPAEDKRANYGSIFPMEFSLLHAKLTRQHNAALDELLTQYDE